MEQLTQNLKDGEMNILEVPFPALNKGCVLVRNHFSVISAGTEAKTVKDARAGYIGKAKARKDEVKKVIDAAKTHGVRSTYQMVMNKLNAPSSLGYSCAGEVIAVADDVSEFKTGDYVACGGATAVHAEVVAVPKNLCANVDGSIPLKHAAFTTIAAIALQGIRQSELRLGENCVVIGLGLIGQLTLRLLNAAGINTIGIDTDQNRVLLARESGADLAIKREDDNLEEQITRFTNGYGTDAVIITAGTASLDPVDLAGQLCRKKGKVIIVGNVPTGFNRKNYFQKELDLRMSSSYGPGRYDKDYEEKGIDYPIGYVRWTEKRNMQAFLDLLKGRKIDMDKLITHEYELNNAADAYQVMLDAKEPYLGLVLKYEVEKTLKESIQVKGKQVAKAGVNIGFIGAGSYAKNFLLPNLKGENLIAVAASRPNNARNAADKYGFGYCTGNADEILQDEKIDTVFIATRHHSHAEYVVKALQNNKHVFVEKPLCMTEEELEEIKAAYEKSEAQLMVGFNRRFAPQVKKIKTLFPDEQPKALNFRINAGTVPADHWIHDREIGGGRIIGEVCHFIDLAMFLAGANISSVSANAMKDTNGQNDTLSIAMGFQNGSSASISYFSNGNKNLPKEYLEVFCNGQVAVVDDFKTLTIHSASSKKEKSSKQDKGHKNEVAEFLTAVKTGKPTPIPFAEIHAATTATFKVLQSVQQSGERISL